MALLEFAAGPAALAGVGGRLKERHTDSPADAWRARYLSQERGKVRMYWDAPPPDLNELCPEEQHLYAPGLHFLTGSNTVFRREALLAAGGYEERHRTNAEDVALCDALRAGGRHFCFTPHATAWHLRRDTPLSVVRTAWNWAFWQRHDEGCYKDLMSSLALLENHVERFSIKMRCDIDDNLLELTGIDLLFLLASVCFDHRHMMKEGRMSRTEAALVQNALLHVFGAVAGGTLPQRVETELGDLFCGVASTDTTLPPAAREKLNGALAALRTHLEHYPESVYDAWRPGP